MEGVSSEGFSPTFPGNNTHRVTKFGDFLLKSAGSERWLVEVVSTQWTGLGSHINTRVHTHTVNALQPVVLNLYDLHAPRAEAGKNSINIMNEGAAVIMSLFPKLTSTITHTLADL